MDKQINELANKILEETGIELPEEAKTKLVQEATKIIMDRSLVLLNDTLLTDEDAQELDQYAKNHTTDETLQHLTEKIPEFTQIFQQQTTLYITEFKGIVKHLKQ